MYFLKVLSGYNIRLSFGGTCTQLCHTNKTLHAFFLSQLRCFFRSLFIATSSGSDLGRPPEDADVISGGSRMSHICKDSPISARSVPAASLLHRRESSNASGGQRLGVRSLLTGRIASPSIGSVLESDGQEGPGCSSHWICCFSFTPLPSVFVMLADLPLSDRCSFCRIEWICWESQD